MLAESTVFFFVQCLTTEPTVLKYIEYLEEIKTIFQVKFCGKPVETDPSLEFPFFSPQYPAPSMSGTPFLSNSTAMITFNRRQQVLFDKFSVAVIEIQSKGNYLLRKKVHRVCRDLLPKEI